MAPAFSQVHPGTPYYFWGGHFYRQSSGVYVSITAPIGAIAPSLPRGARLCSEVT
ncbi:DUF6515 family protein [Congregibacter sp.]|uniref:DUF6515 family protein n=1 Tax=Congregibacter sp. TaxID=2744308 RepID=UPI0038594BBA